MRFVTAREANQAFSQILRDAEGRESLVITRRGGQLRSSRLIRRPIHANRSWQSSTSSP
jgi:antitoxin (DNA-binding transcriptional repressor) of toxin-antitoxin stability system